MLSLPAVWSIFIVFLFIYVHRKWRQDIRQQQQQVVRNIFDNVDASIGELRAEVRELKEAVALLQKQQSAHSD